MAGNNKDDVIAEINLLQQDIREELSHKQDDKDYYANRHREVMSMLKIAESHQGDKPCKTFGPGDLRRT